MDLFWEVFIPFIVIVGVLGSIIAVLGIAIAYLVSLAIQHWEEEEEEED